MGAAAFPISRLGMVRLQGWRRKTVRLIAEEEQESSPRDWGELGAPNERVRTPAASRLGMSDSGPCCLCHVCLCVPAVCSAGIWSESEYVFLITTPKQRESERRKQRQSTDVVPLAWRLLSTVSRGPVSLIAHAHRRCRRLTPPSCDDLRDTPTQVPGPRAMALVHRGNRMPKAVPLFSLPNLGKLNPPFAALDFLLLFAAPPLQKAMDARWDAPRLLATTMTASAFALRSSLRAGTST
ncbi:hypothetical protein K456DRAFT_1294277 [Colletotrichum gloeosporioides 23]|nr:hypothetical protein K456DRAFT_1294277 [Colletotrichum gloeosporioides 23]